MATMDAFLEALTLEQAGEDRYRATNLPSTHGVVFGGTGLPSWLSRFITPSRRWMMKVAAYYASLNDAQFARTAAS